MGNLTDEQLIKRATHAERNLQVLGVLSGLAAIGMCIIAFLTKDALLSMLMVAIPLGLLSAGYWVLAVAAKRGNPVAVGIVIVAIGIQIALLLAASGVSAAKTGGEVNASFPGLLVAVLVMLALGSSYKVLLDLKKRGLWEKVFADVKPSRHLCIIGGALFICGSAGINGAGFYSGWVAGRQHAQEMVQAKVFVDIIRGEEKEFLQSMQKLSGQYEADDLRLAVTKAEVLKKKVEAVMAQTADNKRLQSVLTTYGNAVREWQEALNQLGAANPDVTLVQKRFALGDKMRLDATREFDLRYSPRKKQ